MAAQPEVVKQSDLLSQLVLDRTTLEELGRVEVIWMYPPAHRVLGFICKSGLLGTQKTAFKLPQIQTLGEKSILVSSEPEETDGEKVRQLDSLLNCEVWSDAGNKAGKIVDFLFDSQTGTITQYLIVMEGWRGLTGDVYSLPPSQILSLGRRRVLVAKSAINSLTVYREGVKQKLSKVKSILQEDYSQATQELRSLTEQAKERARSLAEQAKEKAQTLAEQLREESQILTEPLQEKGDIWVEEVLEDLEGWDDEDWEAEPSVAPKQPPTPSEVPPVNPVASSGASRDRPVTPPVNSKPPLPNPDSGVDDDDEPWI